jgi:cytochrome c-type biogenesis protein CcmH/NrfG
MNPLGKRIIVFTMLWVLLVMTVAQVYDNVRGKGLPPKTTTSAQSQPTTEPDATVTRLSQLQACIQASPDNLQCNQDLADFYYTEHQWSQAQAVYEQVVRLDPHNVAMLLKLAGTYIYQEKFPEAVTTLTQAASLKPDSPEIHLLLGLSLSKLEPPQTDQAVAEWRKVIGIDPNSAWARQAQQYITEAGR